MVRRTQKAKTESQKWLGSVMKADAEKPKIIPAIGVKIECRIVVDDEHDWEYVRDTLDRCREFGAAEITEYTVFPAG